jgi:hypothetical protein
MDSTLEPRLRELFEAGAGEPLAGLAGVDRFLPLLTLESGQRIGLAAAVAWIAAPAEGPPRSYAAEHGHVFYEVLEVKRADFEAQLEEAARAAGLPPDEIVLAFPAVGVVRAVLAKGLPYMTRLALLWIRNSELRELRADILAVSASATVPNPIKDLAERLVVPE